MNFSSYHANNGHVDFGRRHAVYDSLDHCKANISDIGIGFGLGHHVPDYESFGTEIEATDVLCGRGKTSFNHGKLLKILPKTVTLIQANILCFNQPSLPSSILFSWKPPLPRFDCRFHRQVQQCQVPPGKVHGGSLDCRRSQES